MVFDIAMPLNAIGKHIGIILNTLLEEVIDELADIIESEILDEGLEFFEKEEKKRW